MRAKRAKQYRKLMNAYALSFGFRPPLQVLLDADLIRAAARFKMNLGNMLANTLGGDEIKPMITQCSIRHLYDSPTTNEAEKREKDNWIEVAKQAERRRCGHHELDTPLSTLECLESVVDPKGSRTNRHRYVVASQDPAVRAAMRDVPGVPIVYINRSVMILEPMSVSTSRARLAEEKSKIRAGLKGRRGGDDGLKRKREDGDGDRQGATYREEGAAAPTKRKKVNGVKGPNPLSVKKAKKEVQPKKVKPVGREPEEEQAAIRKATKSDPQAVHKAVDAAVTVEEGTQDNLADGPRKRKRKRKPKDMESGQHSDGGAAIGGDKDDGIALSITGD